MFKIWENSTQYLLNIAWLKPTGLQSISGIKKKTQELCPPVSPFLGKGSLNSQRVEI